MHVKYKERCNKLRGLKMAKNIEKLYSDLFKLRDSLSDIVGEAKDIALDSREYPGLIGNVLSEQIQKYFIPSIMALQEDTTKPGSLAGVIKFLDAVPLAYTRDKEVTSPTDPIIPENANIEAPSGSSIVDSNTPKEEPTEEEPVAAEPESVDELPLNASYAKPEGEEMRPAEEVPVEEPVEPVRDNVEESTKRSANRKKLEGKACLYRISPEAGTGYIDKKGRRYVEEEFIEKASRRPALFLFESKREAQKYIAMNSDLLNSKVSENYKDKVLYTSKSL